MGYRLFTGPPGAWDAASAIRGKFRMNATSLVKYGFTFDEDRRCYHIPNANSKDAQQCSLAEPESAGGRRRSRGDDASANGSIHLFPGLRFICHGLRRILVFICGYVFLGPGVCVCVSKLLHPSCLITSSDPRDDLPSASLDEVQKIVKNIKAKKAPGLDDDISNKDIKCFPIPLLSLLVAIFNACLKNRYFRPVWKEAEVIGIPKPGKPRNFPVIYRPISFLSGLGKLHEKILKARLSEHLFCKGFIIDEQFGFRPNHSCPQRPSMSWLYGFKPGRIEMNPDKSAAIYFKTSKDKSVRLVPLGTPSLRIHKVPIPWLYSYQYLGITLDMNLHFGEHMRRVKETAIFYQARLNDMLVLRRDLELSTILKYTKDASERFFSIAEIHPNQLLSAAVFYEVSPSHHFNRGSRNALTDLPDALTAEVERLIEINKQKNND
ncbi:Probable RNA-directed DNA polymerase from transposon BS [Eumeta japonica]|uniref:Probable RNA-directed DNA polymerase from transposon BS n=1 Tax=Eumeta variegata TaxID=151549 RepID=A0A4C1TBT0_EUMVA|nr:Probable RNA-directed DNA polymerase from transposon BS [Eumeta japonica]